MSNHVKRDSLKSDEGYNSDKDDQKKTMSTILSDAEKFQQNYFIEKLVNNSANGIIYKGLAN